MFEGILGYVFGGAIIGVLARLLKPGADPMGWIMTILLGIAGAVAGGYIAGTGVMAWLASIAAAIVLLFVFELVRKRGSKHPA